jgi:hypothetical protein
MYFPLSYFHRHSFICLLPLLPPLFSYVLLFPILPSHYHLFYFILSSHPFIFRPFPFRLIFFVPCLLQPLFSAFLYYLFYSSFPFPYLFPIPLLHLLFLFSYVVSLLCFSRPSFLFHLAYHIPAVDTAYSSQLKQHISCS